MDEHPQTIPPPQYPDGSRVVCADGQTLGELVATYREYLIVERGYFFPTNFYVPCAAVAEAGGGDIVLSVTGHDALAQGWQTPPADPVVAVPPVEPIPVTPVQRQSTEAPSPSTPASATAVPEVTEAAAVEETIPESPRPELAVTTTLAPAVASVAGPDQVPVEEAGAAATVNPNGEGAVPLTAPVDLPWPETSTTVAPPGFVEDIVAVEEAVEVQSFLPDATVPPPDQPEETGTVSLTPTFVGIPGRRLTDAELWSLLEPKESPAESGDLAEDTEDEKNNPDKPGS